jgi:uncharacterized protein
MRLPGALAVESYVQSRYTAKGSPVYLAENPPLSGGFSAIKWRIFTQLEVPATLASMFPRLVLGRAREALADTPALLVVGPRQAGKSTLVGELVGGADMPYVTLDDASTLAAATQDAEGWLAAFAGPLAIDEIQKAPGLLPAIKARIDRRRSPGRYILTGSANVLTLPRVSESLAGRIEVLPLWPLAQIELAGAEQPCALLASLFSPQLSSPRRRVATERGWRARAIIGGYPEAIARPRPARRAAWFESYISTVLARDVRDVADIAGLATLPLVLRLIASRSGATLNLADLSRSLEVPQTTMRRYLALLETIFLIHSVPPWHANLGKRLVKAPKIYSTDSGLLAHLLGIDDDSVVGPYDGTLLESFAVFEIVKQCGALERPPSIFHFRAHDGHEVDLVLEDHKGRVVGIEIKATQTPGVDDARGLRWLRDALGRRFVRGVVLHGGTDVVPYDAQLSAVPLAALFEPPR